MGAEPGTLSLVTPLKKNGVFRFGLAHIGTQENGALTAIEEVPMTSIDKFANDVGLKSLDFIKVDVEALGGANPEGGGEQNYLPLLPDDDG